MTDSANRSLWDKISEQKKELGILNYNLGQLDINEQIQVLKYAFSLDEEKYILDHILSVEPTSYTKGQRSLTKGLFESILEAAIYPGNYELEAQELIIALARDFANCKEIIYLQCLKHLDEADKSSDYEVYQRVGGCAN